MEFWPSTNTLLDYYDMGGFVMPPLVLVAIALWYALAYRLMNVRKGRHAPRELIRQLRKGQLEPKNVTEHAVEYALAEADRNRPIPELKSIINEKVKELKLEIGQHKKLVRSLVLVSPLLGLLGTVDGMIETFDSLSDMALFSQSGGIAGGISKALFTTQMGLAISIPGLLIGRMIERKERNISRELDQVKDLVCTQAK